MRTHVTISETLVKTIDRIVGRRQRSRFFAEAAEEKLARTRLAQITRKVAGSLARVEIPGWESTEAAAAWVRASRSADQERLDDRDTR